MHIFNASRTGEEGSWIGSGSVFKLTLKEIAWLMGYGLARTRVGTRQCGLIQVLVVGQTQPMSFIIAPKSRVRSRSNMGSW
jgi:hypothetical protein